MAARGKRFKREAKQYQLVFEDGDLDGFECVMAGVSLGKFIEISNLAATLETPEGRTPENIEKQFTVLAGLLVSWNLDDGDDKPVPATYESLKAEDVGFTMAIMTAYMQALSSVPKASSNGSPSGGTSPEQSLGLASASSVQPS